MSLKFTGKFKDLKKNGYKFHKLFANNYKAYKINVDNKEYFTRGNIWIWVSGRVIEIDDYYYYTDLIVNHFREVLPTLDESQTTINFNLDMDNGTIIKDSDASFNLYYLPEHIRRCHFPVETVKNLLKEIDRLTGCN